MHEPSVRLTAEEKRELQRIAAAEGENPRTRMRATIVLLSAAGQGAEDLAEALGVSERMVRSSRARWRRQAFAGLSEAPRSGRPPRANAAYLRKMLWAVEKDPRSLGFAFARWTAPRLVEYLRIETGVEVTPGWLTELLRTHGFVWRRTKRTTRNLQSPSAVARARRSLLRLKRGRPGPGRTSSSGSATACASISSP